MSDNDNKIKCDTHGESDATFVCQHLVDGENLGFNTGYDEENPDCLCPDAWCDKCEAVVNAEDGWSDKAASFADIKILCAHCYEGMRDKNWIQDDDVLHDLISTSFEYLQERQQRFLEQYKAGDHERWDWYQDTAKLVFSHDGEPQVEADIHFAGTFSTVSNTWMWAWAWANQSLDEKIKASSRRVKDIGAALGLKQLASGRWSATEVDGWEMTAILARELNAIGVYRTPGDSGLTYMVITKAKWVNKD